MTNDPRRARAMRMFLSGLIGALLVGMWAVAGSAATFELARRADGNIVPGVKVEGDIVPGDARKLLDFYKTYGVMISPVHLRSKGGSVEEAMKMGAIIRRLRLETEVPVWDTGRALVDPIKVDHQEDEVCASACFLVYAAGASRFGNYLALHRPFLPRNEARKINDAEYEAAQKAMVPKVRTYLADMEVDQFWIDRMFAANSQEYYMPTWAEADSKVHHLMGMVPSLEEVVLSKCNEVPDVDRKLKELGWRGTPPSAENNEKIKQILQDMDVFFECKKTVLSDMQSAAFERENDEFLKEKCNQFPQLTPSELSRLKALFEKGRSATPDEDKLRMLLFSRNDAYRQCRNEQNLDLFIAANKRWSEEFTKSKRAALPPAADDFDAKGLSAEAMAKKGKEAYDAERYEAALRWFGKAADLGNADAMMGMSWIYGNGRGVPEDNAEAMRWRRMAADRGNTVAMTLIGSSYEKGEGVAKDYAEAMRWYKRAADLGDAGGMHDVGWLYERGQGVEQNYAEAMRWYKKAADRGNNLAMWQVGMFYLYGQGVPKDEAQARVWIKKAAISGFTYANTWLIDHP
jgi:TPR repeat protein